MDIDIEVPDDDVIPKKLKPFEVYHDSIGSEHFSTIEEAKAHLLKTIKNCFALYQDGTTEYDDSIEYTIDVHLTLTPKSK